ncbi:DNA metabolism protein [Subsaximicrobium wynnwilliamsii]|uniref:DNA metabolism protein n=1 Tax=Subsaximicrobium wynnwilliamsii TaxID=291179 RepID=A0A5C6ZNJ0_9FLAO|nr:TIGR03915 family putative DNA repair protein [Subsaximicrobium wynnwilliamsii]TXD85024.1 DNA metabolism protein [Subsaximicrobium wynnwilliamsii]TXD91067.1 DNA metabolism protein [Subsaximicrobium wynnwilliamsii]TXE04461.1 DNA metabolism protein [Subsaximicrobium wynnwilliamsii]
MKQRHLLYDGTFDGFLSCVFYAFEHKLKQLSIKKASSCQNGLFSEPETIVTDEQKANRVWKGLQSKLSKRGCLSLYYAFLSEQVGVEQVLLDYIQYAFANLFEVDTDFSHPSVLATSKLAKSVGREKHRMEAFVRFRLTKDDLYFASIEPDFNVLPLISKHFERRYADQKWVIYDIKRKYGLLYDGHSVEIMTIDFPANFDFTKTESDFFTEQELEFQTLWQSYFKSTNIASRKNMTLHVKHVPKRYWKYLSEKQPG